MTNHKDSGQPDSKFRTFFPSLETLDVELNSTSHLERLFSDLDAPLLKSISLALRQTTPDVGGNMQKFVEKNRQLLKDKVHKLVIQAVVPSLVKSLEKLREFIINSSPGAISMSDITGTFQYDGLWSRSLTHLQLMQSNPPNGISITALYFIADACPNLKSLDISIHHPEMPIVEKGHKPHGLERLIFFNLPGDWIESMHLAIDFISLLDHLFPSMVDMEYVGGREDKPGAVATRRVWWQGALSVWRRRQIRKNIR